MLDLRLYTKEDFKKYDHLYISQFGENENNIYGLVIANTGDKHDSGYNCIRVYALDNNNEILGVLTDYSDVIHFNGIGGYGKENNWNSPISNLVERKSYCIDLLPCGYFRIFKDRSHPFDFSDFIGSDFQIY